jgi:hypothetical protein
MIITIMMGGNALIIVFFLSDKMIPKNREYL